MKNIMIYDDVFELISDYKPECLDNQPEDVLSYLRGFNDFEPFKFLVIDDSQVITIDGLSGDVICDPETMASFVYQSINYARDEMGCE